MAPSYGDLVESEAQPAVRRPRIIILMTASTSTATQTAAAPSSQERWNLTFHLIKSGKNSVRRGSAGAGCPLSRAQAFWEGMLLPLALSH